MPETPRANEYYDYVMNQFLCDTITLLDMVLSDDGAVKACCPYYSVRFEKFINRKRLP